MRDDKDSHSALVGLMWWARLVLIGCALGLAALLAFPGAIGTTSARWFVGALVAFCFVAAVFL